MCLGQATSQRVRKDPVTDVRGRHAAGNRRSVGPDLERPEQEAGRHDQRDSNEDPAEEMRRPRGLADNAVAQAVGAEGLEPPTSAV